MLQTIVDTVVAFVGEHQNWAAPVAFLVALGESFCFLSLFWPGTAILAGITALLAASGANIKILWPSIIAATAGGAFGYALSYWIGRYFKNGIARMWPFSSRPDLIPRGERFFERYGTWSVFFGHFFGPVRAVIPVVAGMFQMRQLPFQIANFVSAFIWAAGVIAPSFFLVTFRDEVFAFVREHTVLVAILAYIAAYLNSIPTPIAAIPTLIAFVAIAVLYLFAGGDPLLILLAGTAGAALGDIMAYRTGKRSPEDFHSIWPNSWSPEAADNARAFVTKWGTAGLFRSKFHTTMRAFVPIALGAVEAPLSPFVALSVLSSLIWAAVLMSPRYILSALGWSAGLPGPV